MTGHTPWRRGERLGLRARRIDRAVRQRRLDDGGHHLQRADRPGGPGRPTARPPGPSHVESREWAAAPFEIVAGEPLRLATTAPRDRRRDRPGPPLVSRPRGRPAAARAGGRRDVGGARRRLARSAPASRSRASSTSTAWAREACSSTASAPRARSGTRRSGTGRDPTWACRCSCPTAATACSSTTPSDAVISVGRSDNGVRIVYTAEAGRLTWYFLMGPDLRGVMGAVAELLGRPVAPAALGAGLLPVHPSLRGHRRAAGAAADDPGEADPVRRARLPLELRRGARLEPRRGAPGVPARALARSGRPARRRRATALRGDHPRVPGAPREVAAVRGRPGERPPAARGLRAGRGDRPRARGLSRRAALHRLLEPGRPRVVVGGRTASCGSSAWPAGGSTGARDRRRGRGSTRGTARCSTTSTTGSASRPSPRARPPTGRTSACSCSAGPAPRGCSGSARRAGRATSTTTSRRWRRRSRSG